MDKEEGKLGLGHALKDSMLLWLLVPIFIPAISCIVFFVAWISGDRDHALMVSNIDFVNSLLVLLVVGFLSIIAFGEKLAWLFFRKRVPTGMPADPNLRILILRDQLAKSFRIIKESEPARKWFESEKEKIERKRQFGIAMKQCLDSTEELAGQQFRIRHFNLWERCTLPSSRERIRIDFSLAGDLLAEMQNMLAQLSLRRCVMIQKIYHHPEVLRPFQDMCDLFESMADQREKDSQNATNDIHRDRFSENYSDEKRIQALSERFLANIKDAWNLAHGDGGRNSLKALFVGCGWKELVHGIIDRVAHEGIDVEWHFADLVPDFKSHVDDFPVNGDDSRMVQLSPPFSGEYSAFAKMKGWFDAVLYAHCLQHSAKSCKDNVFKTLLACVKPGGVAMLAMATSPDPILDGCAVEGLASYETLELDGTDRALFENAFFSDTGEFFWDYSLRENTARFSVRKAGTGIWGVECNHQKRGHVLKICDKYFFYRHRESDNANDGRLLWTFVVNEPISDAVRPKSFLDYAKWKLKNIGADSSPETVSCSANIVFAKAGGTGILLISAKVFRDGTNTTPKERDADRFFCFLCTKLDSSPDKAIIINADNAKDAVASVWTVFSQDYQDAVLAKGTEGSGIQLVFTRPKDSFDPTMEHILFIFEPGGVWRTFLPRVCQFPLSLFERKPAEWLSRCASEFKPFKIEAAFDPPTITRRMSHTTRERIFREAGFETIDEYYHQILATKPEDWSHAGVPKDCKLGGSSDIARDVRFNELPIGIRLELLDDLNVQDVLVSGIRSGPSVPADILGRETCFRTSRKS